MAPKAATKSEGASKAKSSSSGHASYQDMIKEAIISLKNRNGSSRQALKKYVKANNAHLKDVQDSMFDSLFNRALKNGVDKGVFEQPKGPSGGTKLAKPAAAAAKKDAPKKEADEKKPVAKKATTAKKPAAKKAAPKKEAAKKDDIKKAAPKKAAPKKATKAAAPKKADAVVDKPAVLTKTKSGRVAKSTAPKPAAKKAAPKKDAAKKTARKSAPATA